MPGKIRDQHKFLGSIHCACVHVCRYVCVHVCRCVCVMCACTGILMCTCTFYNLIMVNVVIEKPRDCYYKYSRTVGNFRGSSGFDFRG